MATSSPSPTSPLAVSPTSAAISPPETSTPTPDSPSVINANPPDPSTLAPPPSPVASPPPASPPPLEATLSPPPPAATLTPPAPAASPTPPTAIPSPPPPSVGAPPPSALTSLVPTTPVVSPPLPTTATPPLTSPPPPSIPPSSTGTPDVPSPPSDPTSSPPPPTTKPKSTPPSTLRPPHSSPTPPPPASNPQPPVSQSPPPPVPRATHHPPPSAPQPPGGSPSQEPPSASPPSPTVSLLSSPPPVSLSPGSTIDSSGPVTANPPSKGVPVGGVIAIGVVVGVIMLGLIGVVVFVISKRRRRTSIHNGGYIVPSPYGSSPGSDLNFIVKTEVSTPFARSGTGSGTLSPHSHGGLGQSRSWFTYQELYEATSGFALENLLGEGGFGLVHKGFLANGREVAVKHLKVGGSQGEREFQAEVETISRIHHRHLVSLVGYCMYESKRLLVYEYVPNQTLYYHLHGENRPILDWAKRIKIAEGAARGISYLHEDCHPRIIHRDIKSSNILLDTRFEARVSDFGLAKLALDAESHVSTRVMGTFGYMAPEYATSGKLTDKSDVYSFGVVLLELITGRKPVDGSQPVGDESLVEWARPLLSHALHTGQVEGLVDPRLEKSYVESELFLMIEAAAACVRHLATKRPRMGQVVRAFDGRSPSDLSNGMRFGQSEIYDSAQQSAEIRWFRRMAFGSHEYSTDYFSEAIRNTESVSPNQNDQGAGFSTQQGRIDRSQSSQNIYFSSHRTQSPAFSGQWSQNPSLFRQSSQNPISRQQSSQDPTLSGQSSHIADSSGRQNQSS